MFNAGQSILLGVLRLLLLLALAIAGLRLLSIPVERPPASSQARRALTSLHHLSLSQIRLGTLASQRSVHPQVRAYARRLLADHHFLDRRSSLLAQSRALSLDVPPEAAANVQRSARLALRQQAPPSHPPFSAADRDRNREEDEVMAQLRQLEGPEFDGLFLDASRLAQEEAIATLATASYDGAEREVSSWLRRVLPIVTQHHRLAERLITVVGGGPW